ncbi:MAG: hypothetical protein CL760_08660 [Chloroflexi bacterium]|nr:hypothetical protein [Chloroflexota bacterium]MQG05927.1 hypothetical protein [SAR202 cluster bacterium]
MNSKGTGLTLSIGVVIGLIGYILWQLTIGFDTKSDDVVTILQNSASGATSVQIASILICVGLVTHVAGLISTRGTAPGTCETLGITLIVSAIVVWVASSGLGIALAEMGEKFVAASAGAAAGDAASIAAVGGMQIAAGFTQATNVAISTLGGLLAGIGWICIGLAYRGSDAKGLLSFIPLGWLALIQGLILVVATLIINTVVSVDTGSQVSGIAFLLITCWSVLRGIKLVQDAN